jgi:uncharacterized repeat protein (TIGR03847 family)
MPRRIFSFDPPDRFAAGTVGEPGHRTFFLQAVRGQQVISVALEKVQVAALAERLGDILNVLRRRGVEVPEGPAAEPGPVPPLDEPLEEVFRAGTLTLAWDTDRQRVVIEARAIREGDQEGEDEEDEIPDDDPNGPDLLRVRIAPAMADSFVRRANRVVAAGRPPCPMCGQPLDPQGHLCPRRNGSRTPYVN